nr:hypothetical transcript [Hymenolepis microstoma]
MKSITGSHSKNLRKRVRPLRPWIVGLNVPNVVNELSDVKPFIYLCCKISITEQSWVNMPESPKALIVKDADIV